MVDSQKFVFFIKWKEPIDPQFIAELQEEIDLALPAGVQVEVIDTKNRIPDIDWRWFKDGPPHFLMDALIKAIVVDGRIIPTTMSSGVNSLFPTKDTVLNWIGHFDGNLDRYREEPPDFFLEHLFEVDDTWLSKDKEYIYHYTNWETARDFILKPSGAIRFGHIHHMNDPLEFSCLNFPLYGGSGKDRDFPIRMLNAIKWATKDGVQLFCATKDRPAQLFHTSQGTVVIRPAKRGFDHAPMWAHYAKQHEGVCIVFDREILARLIKTALAEHGQVIQSDITYVERRDDLVKAGGTFQLKEEMESWPQAKLNDYARKIVLENEHVFFFSKNSGWSYENEIRWIFIGETSENVFVPIKNALVGAIVGCDFDISQNSEASKISDELGLPIRRIWWNNGLANSPWGLEAFGPGDTLATWEQEAAIRRAARRTKTPKD